MAVSKSIKPLASMLAASALLLTLAACSKCSGSAEVSKASFIATQDAICAQTTPVAQELAKEMAKFRTDMSANERLQVNVTALDLTATYYQQLSDALAKAPAPKEDAATWQELLANNKLIGEKAKAGGAMQKKAAELLGKLGEVPEGEEADPELSAQIQTTSEEILGFALDVASLTQKQVELAQKYGFKSCFLPKQ